MRRKSPMKIKTSSGRPENRETKRPSLTEWSSESEAFRKEFDANAKPINFKVYGLIFLCVILIYTLVGLIRFLMKQFPDKGLEILDSVLLWIFKR